MARRAPPEFLWFVGGVASWALAAATNQVGFSWLMVGVAQMCQALPALAFIPVGGLLADRVELRRMMAVLHVAAAALAALVASGSVGLGVLLPYALCWGTTLALAAPPRDAVISHVAGAHLCRRRVANDPAGRCTSAPHLLTPHSVLLPGEHPP